MTDLKARISILGATSTTNGKQDFGDRIVAALCSVLRKHNVETPSTLALKKSSAYSASKNKIHDLATFFESISSSKLIQDQVLKTAIELLYFDLLNWKGISVSSHTLLNQMHRLPSTLNRHFPGYAQSGLLTKVIGEKHESH
jgi:hypothetical protein